MISQGEGMDTDSDIVLDGDGKPFIPGTSWTGAIKSHCKIDDTALMDIFFGNSESSQSILITKDLFIIGNGKKEIRTNTSIDSKTQTAKDQSLHNYEVLSAGNLFDFGFELVLKKAHEKQKEDIVKLVKTIVYELEHGNITLGAKTNSGFGKVKLSNTKYKELSFPHDAEWWLTGEQIPSDSIDIKQSEIYSVSPFNGSISGTFLLDGSILVKQSYTGDDDNIDSEQMQSNGKNIIPGTSIKGVIRHRAEKIMRTLNKYDEKKIQDLFGYVKERDRSAKKGRISISECIITGGSLEKQTRIRVDMLTGGAEDGALFSELPLWSDGNTSIDVDIKIKAATEFDMALLLQVMKDLWTGNLTLGGEASIGRGRFSGKDLLMTLNQNSIKITVNNDSINIEDENDLIPILESAWEEVIALKEEVA